MLFALARLARLPALVALNPPADAPLIMLWLVIPVLDVLLVVVLCVPLDELVALDFVVNVRPKRSPLNSYADLRFRNDG